LNDDSGEETEEWDEDHALDMVLNDMVSELDESDLDIDGDGIITDEERAADLDGDGLISEEEYVEWYENQGGWRSPFQGRDYWHHPKFDWKKTERWINDRRAIDYWMKNRGGSSRQLQKIKDNNYPTDFSSKTY